MTTGFIRLIQLNKFILYVNTLDVLSVEDQGNQRLVSTLHQEVECLNDAIDILLQIEQKSITINYGRN